MEETNTKAFLSTVVEDQIIDLEREQELSRSARNAEATLLKSGLISKRFSGEELQLIKLSLFNCEIKIRSFYGRQSFPVDN